MKRQAFMILTTLSLLVILAATSVYAQISNVLGVAKIPFEFSVGNKVLPAGEYTVSQMTQDTLVIRNVDFSASDIVLTIPTRARTTPNESALVFNRYGDQYFLSKVWTTGNDTGRELSKPPAEEELIRARSALAKSASERQIVSIPSHR